MLAVNLLALILHIWIYGVVTCSWRPIALVNNINADNARLLTASLVTSTPRVPFNYPSLPLSLCKGVRLYDSVSISSFHKFSRCAPFLVMPHRNLQGSHQERMTRHSTVLPHIIRIRGFESRSRDMLFQGRGRIIYWKTSREYLCTYKLANSKQLDIFHGHKNLHKTALLLTYILSYSMERSPSSEANRFSASQEIPPTLWNPKVHCPTHNCPMSTASRLIPPVCT
jgi:hypothetical protein